MFAPSSETALQIAALILGIAAVSLTGCDTAGDGGEKDYEVTDDLSDRIDTTSSDANPNALSKSGDTNVSFKISARVQPPTIDGTGARATSLSSDGDNLYIGYLLLGRPFGGGIDILDAEDPTNLVEATSLQSSDTDVQAVASPSGDANRLYAAEAVPQEGADTPSRVSVIALDGRTVRSVTSRRLSGNVAKSVAVEPSDPGTGHDLHVITDENSLYRFDEDLSAETMLRQRAEEGVEFSGLATHQSQVFTLSLDGRIYYSSWGDSDLQGDAADLGQSGIDQLGIGRLAAYDKTAGATTQDARVFAALGDGGFAILDDDADDVKYRHTSSLNDGNYFTSVTLHGHAGGKNIDLVYAAGRQGTLDVYKVPGDGIGNGLTLVRRLYLRKMFEENSVNYALGVQGDNTVYVSGGGDGTLVLELGTTNTPKAVDFAAFCSRSDAQEADVTVTDVQTNDADDPIEINWTSDTELSSVVLKAGIGMYSYPGGTSGTARSEAGDTPGPNQAPSSPCPAEEDLVLKNEDI